MKVTYVTKTDANGNKYRYRKWDQVFKDEDTGEEVTIARHELIKVNGYKVRFYGHREYKSMTPKQREYIKLRLK